MCTFIPFCVGQYVLGEINYEQALAISQSQEVAKVCKEAQRQQILSTRNYLKEEPLVPLYCQLIHTLFINNDHNTWKSQ